jgi:hypothetical protein
MLAAPHAAGAQPTIASCYAASGLRVTPPRATRSVFVLVDQTTALDADMRATIEENFQRLLGSGTTFAIGTFSAFSRGHFTTIVSAGATEGAVPDHLRPNLPVNRLNAIDHCLVRQVQYARRISRQALIRAMSVPATTFANSEIMMSLADLSQRVRAAPSPDRIVIIASDLMEHSSASSFYARHNLRVIDPGAEMRNAVRLRLTGDFGRARIYVIGTGILPPEGGNMVRPVHALNALVEFWTMWFSRSNAAGVVIGRPNVVAPIR